MNDALLLPQIVTLGSGERVRITRVDATDIVFDRLGLAPAEGQPEIVTAPACGVHGGTFSDLAAVVAQIENPPVPPMTNADIEHLADTTLDGWAKAWGYTTAARAVTYVGDPNPRFNAEGVAIRNARSALWTGLSAAAEAQGEGPAPTRAEVVAFIAQFAPVRPQPPYV